MKKLVLLLPLIILMSLSLNELYASGNHKNHLGLFLGSTSNLDAKHTDFTLGADYEYRLPFAHGLVGIGFIGDVVLAEHKEMLFMGSVIYHPLGSLKFYVGNGLALAEHEVHAVVEDHHSVNGLHKSSGETQINSAEAETETQNYYVFRIGTGYDFHVGGFSLTPTFNWDIINGHSSLAYGLTFGLGF